MGRLLGQLFEITGLFDMHLRPELVLLQKTMVTVEGVARRIDADSDIWEAARPVVERWIRRELSPKAQIERHVTRAVRVLERLAERIEAGDPPVSAPPAGGASAGLWLGVGLAVGLTAAALTLTLLHQ